MGGLSPLGDEWKTISGQIQSRRSAIEVLPELAEYSGMATRLAALIHDFETPSHYPRKSIRSMGRVSLLATRATERALAQAELSDHPLLASGRVGVSYGSTSGSPPAMEVYINSLYTNKSTRGVRATDYIQLMSHTVPANLAQFFGIKGRQITTCSACTSGSQGIGFGYESIVSGKQDIMVSGGAEEYHIIESAVFDILYATSTRNDTPQETPRPFDVDRDGLVVGEGAGTLILEELEHARARGVKIHAELVGFGTNCDGLHITNPDAGGMQRVIELALEDAGLASDKIGYVNAHGTATEAGDIAESVATHQVFGDRLPVSSLKSFMGHTLGACGPLEAWFSIEMMREGWFAPTLNLASVDPRCGALDYIQGDVRELQTDYVMTNNFAFGGVNTSLIFKRWLDA
jgi:3-oxoacyl-[acyl-carrier-protein] synthase II